jgi:homoserine kinase type II
MAAVPEAARAWAVPLMQLNDLWTAWPVAGPWRLTPLTQGANNLAYWVTTPDGAQLVLRVLLNHADEDRLRAEQLILACLAEANLPFALPEPIPTRGGLPFLRLAQPGTSGRLLVLTHAIAGEHPRREDASAAESAAQALGQLDRALADIELPPDLMRALPNPYRRVRSWARNEALSSQPSPLAHLHSIGLATHDRQRVRALLHETDTRLGTLYDSLPQQLIHGDFDGTNVLVADGRVSGVLDFEFATFDLRVLDLVVALSWWPVAHLGTGAEWPLIDALGRGYSSVVAVSADEVEALPALLRLRALGSLLHRIERFAQGHATPEEVLVRVQQTLRREDWLGANTPRLLEMAHAWRDA